MVTCCKVTNRYFSGRVPVSSAGCAVGPWRELGKEWQQGQHKAAFQEKATSCSHQLLARPPVSSAAFSRPRSAATLASRCHQVTSSFPGHHPSPRAGIGAQCSQLGQRFCSALSAQGLPAVPEPWLSPAISQAGPRCLQTELLPTCSFPGFMQRVKVPLAPRSPTASVL